MHFDALCLAAMRQELHAHLCPGRVQQVVLAGPRTLGFELYAGRVRHALLVHADPAGPRLHRVEGKIRRGPMGDTPLLLLLRKYVRDAILTEIVQPVACERLVELRFDSRSAGPTSLMVELTGRASNAALVNGQGMILDCLLRIPPSPKSTRVLMPGRPWTPPPLPPRLPPWDDGSPDYYERLLQVLDQPGPLWKALMAGLAGVSPTQAREVAWRATGNADAVAGGQHMVAVAAALQDVWGAVRSGRWQPGIWRVDGRAAGYAPYEFHATGEFAPRASLSLAIEEWLGAQKTPTETPAAQGVAAQGASGRDGYAEQRAAAVAEIRRARTHVEHLLRALDKDEPPPGVAASLRTQAEWLLALQHTLAPAQQSLTVPAEYTGGEALVIARDLERTPVEQAEQLFRRAGKYERAARIIPERRALLRADLGYLAQLDVDLANATNQPEIAAVRADLIASRLLPLRGRAEKPAPRVERATRQGPPAYRAADGSRILVGRHARENDRLTFTIARAADHWLHARGLPGSHVVVQGPDGREPSQEALHAAALLAAWYSAARGEASVDVIVTRRRNVSRAPGGHPGQVLVRKEEVVRVSPLELDFDPAAPFTAGLLLL